MRFTATHWPQVFANKARDTKWTGKHLLQWISLYCDLYLHIISIYNKLAIKLWRVIRTDINKYIHTINTNVHEQTHTHTHSYLYTSPLGYALRPLRPLNAHFVAIVAIRGIVVAATCLPPHFTTILYIHTYIVGSERMQINMYLCICV